MSFETIIYELIVIFSGASLLATLFLFLKQPIIIAYILSGLLLGPYGSGILKEVHHIEYISHLGIIFLLFLIGLNLHPEKLWKLFKKTFLTTILTSFLFILTFSVFLFIGGFSFREGALVSIILMFSSTVVSLKLVPTTTLHQKRLGELMISILLLQDIIAVLFLLLIRGSKGSFTSLPLHFLFLFLKGLGVILISYFLFRYVVLYLFQKFAVIQEYIFVMSIGWCFFIAGLSRYAGLSYEIGAFLAGCIFAISPISLVISERLKPLREFFLILFFFGLGAQTNIFWLKQVLAFSLLGGIFLVFAKVGIFHLILHIFQKDDSKLIPELSFRLSNGSEFSLLVAYLARAENLINTEMFYVIQFITILSWVISTYLVVYKYPSPISPEDTLRKD